MIGKLYAQRIARALFCGVWTPIAKVLNFPK